MFLASLLLFLGPLCLLFIFLLLRNLVGQISNHVQSLGGLPMLLTLAHILSRLPLEAVQLLRSAVILGYTLFSRNDMLILETNALDSLLVRLCILFRAPASFNKLLNFDRA